MPGRGRSDWLAGPFAYHFPQFLGDLRALIAGLGVESVEWVGTSMGGLLGLMLAAEPGTRIERLVLNDVGAFVPGDALAAIGRNLRAPARFETMAALGEHVRHTHRHWGPMTEAHWRHLVRHSARRVPGGYALHYDPAIAQVLSPLPFSPGVSLWSLWHRVRCPVLILRGESSAIMPPEVVRAMVAIKPGTRVVEIPGAGHAPSLMAPDQIAVVADFLADRRPADLERAA